MNTILRNPWSYLIFLLPAVVIFSVFAVVPIIQTVYYSLFQWDGIGDMSFKGLGNYTKLFSDDIFYIALKNTIYLMLFSVFVGVSISLTLAILLSQKIRAASFFKTSVFIPTILSTVIVGMIWNFVYHPRVGTLNAFLEGIGLEAWTRPWLTDPDFSFLSVLVANTWQWVGFHTVILLAGVLNIPKDVLEAASIDGVNRTRRVFNVIIPLMWPTLIVDILLNVTGSLRAFDIVYVMTLGGPNHQTELLATYMYSKSFTQFDYGYGSAIAVSILVLTLIVSVILQRFSAERGE